MAANANGNSITRQDHPSPLQLRPTTRALERSRSYSWNKNNLYKLFFKINSCLKTWTCYQRPLSIISRYFLLSRLFCFSFVECCCYCYVLYLPQLFILSVLTFYLRNILVLISGYLHELIYFRLFFGFGI